VQHHKVVFSTGGGFEERFKGYGRSALSFLTAVVEVHKSIAGRKSLLEFLARHNFARPLEQHQQHLKGLLLKPYLHSVLAQLTGLKINCEGRETNTVGGTRNFFH
jgi:hypothetical protein